MAEEIENIQEQHEEFAKNWRLERFLVSTLLLAFQPLRIDLQIKRDEEAKLQWKSN